MITSSTVGHYNNTTTTTNNNKKKKKKYTFVISSVAQGHMWEFTRVLWVEVGQLQVATNSLAKLQSWPWVHL